MKIVDTSQLTPASIALMRESEKLWLYNGLDCCVTLEVLNEIKPQLDNVSTHAYEFSKSLQGPILEMNMRGVALDHKARTEVIEGYQRSIEQLEKQFSNILIQAFGMSSFNWRSHDQLKNLFYNIMRIPPVKKRNDKGEYVQTVDREALEKLDVYMYARPLIRHILLMRDIGKKISVLKTAADTDGRMRTSYNIAGTTTFRLSSSLSEFGSGGNLQNIEEKLRSAFVADPGYMLGYIDKEQAESRAVGAICWNLFGASAYLDACESGDLHTAVTRLAFPSLPWTGDLKKDREVAEQPFYRQHSYRHMCKVLGHGTNYYGKPPQMSVHTKIDKSVIQTFQSGYFRAFPEIPRWHEHTREELQTTGYLINLTGHRRHFLGRRNEETTLREAIAYDPQSSIAVLVNRGMREVWRARIVQLLLQIHDAILFQFPANEVDTIIPNVIKLFNVPLELRGGRMLYIPSEPKVGFNWGPMGFDKATGKIINPGGLRKWKPGETYIRP